jgi:all-trans-nonaprenyl-diphosphate synthase
VAVGAAMLTALLYVRRWTLLPLAAAVRALCGFGRATPRFRNGADQQSELGIHIPGMKGRTLVTARSFPVHTDVDLKDITNPVLIDLVQLRENLTALVGASNPRLQQVANQIFGAGGKRLRPVIVFLVARATCVASGLPDLQPQHRRLAEVIEMIHTASLLHDDVVDNSDTRRGSATAHQRFGTSVAVLAGDYMFAQSSWYLACLENLTVIKLISRVIADFADGEVAQAGKLFDAGITMDDYLAKSFNKTATLIAAACKSAAVFSQVPPRVCDMMYNYGKHLGLAFQVVDDILDFTQDSETLGKPAGSDLASGNITAPALLAFPANPELRGMIASRFEAAGSLDHAIEIIKTNGGIAAAQLLAKEHGDLAKACLQELPPSPYKTSLEMMVDYTLSRIY